MEKRWLGVQAGRHANEAGEDAGRFHRMRSCALLLEVHEPKWCTASAHNEKLASKVNVGMAGTNCILPFWQCGRSSKSELGSVAVLAKVAGSVAVPS